MSKIHKILILLQLMLSAQNITQCAAKIETEQGETAFDFDSKLVRASRDDNKEKVMQLINAGANVNAINMMGYTALMWAATRGNKEIVELLIKRGANVNAVAGQLGTALMWAARSGRKEIKEIVELLTKAKADVNFVDNSGNTALICAAQRGREEMVELLLRAGSDIDHKNTRSWKAIDYAQDEYHHALEPAQRIENKKEIVKMLQDEPSRRKTVIKKWIKENLAKKITESTPSILIVDIANIIAEYAIEYTDIPLEYRLTN